MAEDVDQMGKAEGNVSGHLGNGKDKILQNTSDSASLTQDSGFRTFCFPKMRRLAPSSKWCPGYQMMETSRMAHSCYPPFTWFRNDGVKVHGFDVAHISGNARSLHPVLPQFIP